MADNRNWTETLSSPGPIKKSEAIYMVSGRLPSSSIRTVTVGSGISPDQPPKRVADYNCRWGLSPRPEVLVVYYFIPLSSRFVKAWPEFSRIPGRPSCSPIQTVVVIRGKT